MRRLLLLILSALSAFSVSAHAQRLLGPVTVTTLNGTTPSAFGLSIFGSADAGAARTYLGLGTGDAVVFQSLSANSGSFSGLASSTLTVGSFTVAPFANTILPVFSQNITFAGPTAARTYTLPDASATLVSTGAVQTLTNKSISFGSNTLTGTIAELNTAVSDADLATLGANNFGGNNQTNMGAATGTSLVVTGSITLGASGGGSLLLDGASSGFDYYNSHIGVRIGSGAWKTFFNEGQIGTLRGGGLSWSASTTDVYGIPFVATISRYADGELQIGTTTNNASGSLRLTNLTASGTVTIGGGTAIAKSAVYSLESSDTVAAGAIGTLTISATGVAPGDKFAVDIPLQAAGLVFKGVRAGTDELFLDFENVSGSTKSFTGTFRVRSFEE